MQAQAAESTPYELSPLDILNGITPEQIITIQAQHITFLEEQNKTLHRKLQEMTIVASLIDGDLIKQALPQDSYHSSPITDLTKELIRAKKSVSSIISERKKW